MKKVLILCVVFFLGLCGCAGVPEEDYLTVIEERDNLRAQIELEERYSELNEKAIAYRTSMEVDYEYASYIIDVYEELGLDMSVIKKSFDDSYSQGIEAINTVETTARESNGNEEAISEGIRLLDDLYLSWQVLAESTYGLIDMLVEN